VRRILVPVLAATLGLTALTTASPAVSAVPDSDRPFPSRIELPDGFQPEGIAIGPGPVAWFGSRADGDLYRVSLRTGEGEVVSQGPGTASVGLKSDRRGRLFVAGGDAGTARVVDSDSGDVVADYTLSTAPTFVNDVVLTKRAAWFTDSARPQLYRVDRDSDGAPGSATTVPLTGEWEQGTGFGANGISTTPTGKALLVVNSTTGLLYRVEPATGVATELDLGGASLTTGDGMLRHGRLLYVVRNRLNEVAVIRLDRRGESGTLVRTITSDDFDVPTTVARFGSRLYLPNARFSTPPTPTTDYWVTQVRAKS
jgi:sugar lactone lactonase YvrE